MNEQFLKLIPYKVSDFAINNLSYLSAYSKGTISLEGSLAVIDIKSYLIIYFVTGNGVLSYNTKNFDINDGTVLFIPCEDLHSYTFKMDSPISYEAILINGGFSKNYYDIYHNNSTSHLQFSKTSNFCVLLQKLTAPHSVESKHNELQISLGITALLTELLSQVFPKQDSSDIPSYLSEIKALFDSDFSNSYTLDSLAKKFHINKYRIAKDFSNHFQISPMLYLHTRRMENAMILLQTTELTITQIASMSGYDNINHFIHQFKNKNGITPTEFRKQYH